MGCCQTTVNGPITNQDTSIVPWERLKKRPFESHPPLPLVFIDSNIFICISVTTKGYRNIFGGVCAYTTDENKWIKLIKYPDSLKIECDATNWRHKYHDYAYNEQNNVLYICVGWKTCHCLITLNINTSEWNIYDDVITYKHTPKLVIMNDKLHLISITDEKKMIHLKWNDMNHEFDKLNEIDTMSDSRERALIHIKSTNTLWIFCEEFNSKNYQYNICTNQWSELQMNLPSGISKTICGVITPDNKYIIWLTGPVIDCSSRYLVVYDIENDEYFKSVVEYPRAHLIERTGIIINDNQSLTPSLMVYGFIRNYEYFELIVHDIIDLIISMVPMEMFYIIDGYGYLYRTELNKVLQRK